MRARDLPNEWEKVLEAMNNHKWEEAKRIIFKYRFNAAPIYTKREQYIREAIYYLQYPDGEIAEFDSFDELAVELEMTVDSVRNRMYTAPRIPWKKGPLKNHVIWREQGEIK